MFALKERPYSAHVLISFWCDSDNKNFDFFTFQNFRYRYRDEILVFLIFDMVVNNSK